MNFLNQSAPIYDSAITMLQKRWQNYVVAIKPTSVKFKYTSFFCVIQLATFNISI